MVKWWSELQMQLTVTTPLVKRRFRKARRLFFGISNKLGFHASRHTFGVLMLNEKNFFPRTPHPNSLE